MNVSIIHQHRTRRGNALILVVGILVLLVLVATAFITKTQSGRATAVAQRDSSQLSDRADTILKEIASEVALALFTREIVRNEAIAFPNSANSPRKVPHYNAQRYGFDIDSDGDGIDQAYPFNYAPYEVVPWTNPPDNLIGGIPLLGPRNPWGGPSFGDARWLRDTEPQRADIVDLVGQGIPTWVNTDGTPETFTHWRHLTNLSRSGNALRIVRDISDVTGIGDEQGPALVTDLDVPIEQWPAARPQSTGIDGESNYGLWVNWLGLNGYANALAFHLSLPHNFLDLSDLDGDGIHNEPFAERPLDAFVRDTNRWNTERWITDTDGDGFTDAFWHLYPQNLGPDTKQLIAVSVTDNSALGNMNVATRFHRKDYVGVEDTLNLRGEATKGHTPADLALVGQNEQMQGNTTFGILNWRVGFMDNMANLPGNDLFDGNEWIDYIQIGANGYPVNVDWNEAQWKDRANASLLDELGIEINEWQVNPVFNDSSNLLNPTDDINSIYGRLWYWQLAGRDPFSATNGLRPFTVSDELELRIAEGNNYQFAGSRLERSVNDIIGNVDGGEVQNQFLRSDYQHRHEASDYRDQLNNRQLLFDNRRKLTVFSGSRNDLLPPWIRWEDRFWNRHDPEGLNLPSGYDALDLTTYEDYGIPAADTPGLYGSMFPMRVAIEAINALDDNGQIGLENAVLNWREQSRTKLDLREYYSDSSAFIGTPWWESDIDGRLLFSERLPLQLLLAMTDSQEAGGRNLDSVHLPAHTPLGTQTTIDPDGDWASIATNYYQQARLAAAGLASNILTYRDADAGWRQHSTLPFTSDSSDGMNTLPLSQAVTPPIIGRQSNDQRDPEFFDQYKPYADANVAGPHESAVELLGMEAQPFIVEVFIAHAHQAKQGGDHWACCLETGGCEDVSEDTCEALLGGTFLFGNLCDPNGDGNLDDSPCPNQGACCLEVGGCIFTSQVDCEDMLGTYQGDDVSCSDEPCFGACCVDGIDANTGEGECLDISQSSCNELGSAFAGFDTDCASTACTALGSCCFASGTCMDALSSIHCTSLDGIFTVGILCNTDPCPIAACCLTLEYGACLEATEETCFALNGEYQGEGTLCFGDPCPTDGACCFASGSCVNVMTDAACMADGGIYTAGASCADGALLTSVLSPTADAMLQESSPTLANGALESFSIGEEAGNNRLHLVMDYLIDDAIEAGDITNAVIVLNYEQFSGNASTVSVARLTQSWESDTVTWSTFNGSSAWPNGGGAFGDADEALPVETFSVGTAGDVKIHVEELVQDAILNHDRVLSLVMYKTLPDGAVSNTQFASNETATGTVPTLSIQYILGVSPCAASCCISVDVCESVSEDTCDTLGGTFTLGVTCTDTSCKGSCCFATGGCEILSQESCEESFSATYLGPGTSCDIDECGIEGACCLQYTPDEIWLNELLYDNSPVWVNEFQYDSVDAVWINELHYDNIGDDVDEFIEIALDSYIDQNTVEIVLYDGNTGAVYETHEGSALVAGEVQNGKTMYSITLGLNGLQDDIDGIAIVIDGAVAQFISYEGTFIASDGPAIGMTSTDFGVSQSDAAVGSSIGINGTGSNYADYSPVVFALNSIGFVNEAQQINENELIEIALDSEIDPTVTSVQMLLYDGEDGSQYAALDVGTFLVGNTQSDMTLYYTLTTLQDGVDGIALTIEGSVKQFMSYEGSFTATDGAAIGLDSIEISATQSGGSALASLGLTGAASEFAGFNWSTLNTRSPGIINSGQVIEAYEEFLELAVSANVTIGDVSIELYGSDGAQYAAVNGSTLTQGETQGGMDIYSIEWSEDFLANGPAAIAIIRDAEVVGTGIDRQFLSYEGDITAIDGTAIGMTSSQIPVPLNNAIVGTSIGLIGNGSYYSVFAWSEFAIHSMGDFNVGETIELLEETEVCIEVSTTSCDLLSGTFQGEGISCGSVPCGAEIIRGSCCFDSGECEDIDSSTCHELEGAYQGDGISCVDAPCVPEGACCLESTSCLDLDQSSCEGLSGTFLLGDTCLNSPCFGSCCLAGGGCVGTLSQVECEGKLGTYSVGTTCDEIPCIGACCIDAVTCEVVSSLSCQTVLGGVFEGIETLCSTDPCAIGFKGACCLSGGQACAEIYSIDCASLGGVFSGDATTCQTVLCFIATQVGACCLVDGTCADVIAEKSCGTIGGTYQGDNSACSTSPCTGACCLASGSCVSLIQTECDAVVGTFMGTGTACETNPCRGACCLASGSCIDVKMQPTCEFYGGAFNGFGTVCSTSPCYGACCTEPVGCEEVSILSCSNMGGTFIAVGTSCVGEPCIDGTCCLPSGTCLETTENACTNLDMDTFFILGARCDTDPCLGACCLWSGGCVLVSIDTCNSFWDPDGDFAWEEPDQPGFWNGFGSICDDICTPAGSCCMPSGSCVDIMDVSNSDTAPDGFVYYCEEVMGGTYRFGEACIDTVCVGACCLPSGCENLPEDTCDALAGDYLGGSICADSPCNLGACCFDSGSCLELTENSCVDYYGGIWSATDVCLGPDGLPNSGDEPCVGYFIVTDDVTECPQETIAVVQLANPFDREIDLNDFAVELFGQDFKLEGLGLVLPPATEYSPSTLLLYTMPDPVLDPSTIIDPLAVHDFEQDWFDFLDIDDTDRPDNSVIQRVPGANWSTDRTYYDGLTEGEQNSVALYKFDGTVDVDQQRVLIDRLDPPDSVQSFDARVVADLETEWSLVGSDGYVVLTDQNGDRIEAEPDSAALLVQWDRATRAWGTDIPDVVRFNQTSWQNEHIDPWERNPRYVFAARDFIRSSDIGKVTTPTTDPPTGDILYTSSFKWADDSDPLDPDDLDGDGIDLDGDGEPDINPDDPSDDDLLPDNPDPWFTVEVWSPRAGVLRLDATEEGQVVGSLRRRKPTYFDMNHTEDPLFNVTTVNTAPKDQPWSFPDKGWYGQRVDDDGDMTTSDTPAFEDLDDDRAISLNEIDMAMAFPLQMLQKDDDFEQVGEVLNCWLFGHMLEGAHNQVDDDAYLVLPISPLDGGDTTAVDSGTIVTFSEFMYPRWDTVEDWWAPWVAVVDTDEIVLNENINRLRFIPEGIPEGSTSPTPLMMGGRSDIGDNVPVNHAWPRLPIASRVLDSFVCDGPGRPDRDGNGFDTSADDLNPAAINDNSALPSTHSFYNANGYSGKATPGIININTAPVEVLRMLPHMYKLVHETDAANTSTLDVVDRNPRSLIPESIIQWREGSNGNANLLIGTGIPGGPNYSNRWNALGLSEGAGPKDTRGFSSPSEIGLLQTSGQVDDVLEPWHIDNRHQSVKDADAWRIDFARWGPFDYHDYRNSYANDYSIARLIDTAYKDVIYPEVGAPISTEVIHNTYFVEDTIIGDGVSGDFEEKNLLQSGISNLIGTTSDMFTVHMRIRTFKRNPVTGVWDATDLDQIIDDSRYVMLVDRSNVDSPSDKPRILYFEKLPN